MEETKEIGDNNVISGEDIQLEGKNGNLRKRRIIQGVNTDEIAGNYHDLIPYFQLINQSYPYHMGNQQITLFYNAIIR